MTTENEQVYLMVGEPVVYDQHGTKLTTTLRTDRPEGLFIQVHVSESKPATLQQFMPGVTLTKPSIRVPVYGQEFIVQSVHMDKGQICVDVTPPAIKDQFGNVLPVTSWNNDIITVKDATASRVEKDHLETINNLKAELVKVRADNSTWREHYRLEQERANKLQDDTAKVKRELTEENIRLTVALEAAHKEMKELVSVRIDLNNLKNTLHRLSGS